jgi:hypothetical protein
VSEQVINIVDIDQVIGPRLDRRSIVVETRTPAGQIALRLSAGAAASLSHALTMALRAGASPDLPHFLGCQASTPAAAHGRPGRLRTFLRNARRGLLASALE